MPTWMDNILRGAARIISSRGTSLPTRVSLNFASPLVATDNSGSDRTDVTVDATVSTGPGAPTAAGELAAYADTGGAALARTYISASVPLAGTVQLAPTTAGETMIVAGGDAPGATGGDVLILAGDGTAKGKAFFFDIPASGYSAEKWIWVANGTTNPTDANTTGAWLGAVDGKLYTLSHADGLGQLARTQPGDTFADNQLVRFVGTGGRKMRAAPVTISDAGEIAVPTGHGVDAPSADLMLGASAATATLSGVAVNVGTEGATSTVIVGNGSATITLDGDVTGGGWIYVPASSGIDTASAGDLAIGTATATSVSIGSGATTITLDGPATSTDSLAAPEMTATAPETAMDAIANKVAHWRADRGVTSDVNGVSVWTDSVSSRTLSQSTNSKKPGASGTLRGKPALTFDGGDVLVSDEAAANWIGLHDGTGVTIACVWRRSEITGGRGVLDTCNQPISGSAATVGFCLYSLSGATATRAVVSRANATPAFDQSGKASNYIGTNFDIIRHKTGGSPGDWDYTANGRHFIGSYGGAASGSNPSYTLHVGAFADESNALVGSIAEIIIWSRYLTDAELEAVETYLCERYYYSPESTT